MKTYVWVSVWWKDQISSWGIWRSSDTGFFCPFFDSSVWSIPVSKTLQSKLNVNWNNHHLSPILHLPRDLVLEGRFLLPTVLNTLERKGEKKVTFQAVCIYMFWSGWVAEPAANKYKWLIYCWQVGKQLKLMGNETSCFTCDPSRCNPCGQTSSIVMRFDMWSTHVQCPQNSYPISCASELPVEMVSHVGFYVTAQRQHGRRSQHLEVLVSSAGGQILQHSSIRSTTQGQLNIWLKRLKQSLQPGRLSLNRSYRN